MSPTHLATDPASTPTAPTAPAWHALSAALTDQVPALADRDDLVVRCAPGAGGGAPGCFHPPTATIELDGAHLGVDPATADPARPSDRERYPAFWGILAHEAAHAAHSRWTTALPPTVPPTVPPAVREAAFLLEESRIEATQLARRPGDRHWLRACTATIILADFTTPTPDPVSGSAAAGSIPTGTTPPTPGGPVPTATASPSAGSGPAATGTAPATAPGVVIGMDAAAAGQAAGLILARVDAGVLDDDEAAPVAREVEAILGAERLSALEAIWRQAQDTADDDGEGMLALGARWCAVLGIDPTAPTPPPGGGTPSPLAAAITTTLAATTDTAGSGGGGGDRRKRNERRADDQRARTRAARAAGRVFGIPHGHEETGDTALRGTRLPTPAERAAAARLARALRDAGTRDRVPTTISSATPPGRLRMRAALAADAQRAAGAVPTAQPFTRTSSRHTPTPPLRVGIAADVSGSMSAFAAPVASAAWILARAVQHVPDSRSATVIFGRHVRPITRPGVAPATVTEFHSHDSYEKFGEAVDALTHTVELTRPGAARLLVIVSDGQFHPTQRTGGEQRVRRLVEAGCGVLWLAFGRFTDPMPGAQVVRLTDPADAAVAIGTAATRALRHA